MSAFLDSLKSKINASTIVGLLTAAIATSIAFGAHITGHQTAEILVLGNSVALILFAHGLSNAFKDLTAPTVVGLVTAIIGVAVSFGLPITNAQSSNILTFTGIIAGLLLAHGALVTHTQSKEFIAHIDTEDYQHWLSHQHDHDVVA